LHGAKAAEFAWHSAPQKVLGMKEGKAAIAKEADCIKCRLCEYRCPDFAIIVETKKEDAS